MNDKHHWESIYSSKEPREVSWYQQRPDISLALIESVANGPDARIIDVGGGASTLVDHLLEAGYRNLTVLDISARGLEKARQRLGSRADEVRWIVGDITQIILPADSFDIWHDRAVFHFLTAAADRRLYLQTLDTVLRPGGHVIIATFAVDGPDRCSGLEVVRYSIDSLQQEFGQRFHLIKHQRETHRTPFDTHQTFLYCDFEKL